MIKLQPSSKSSFFISWEPRESTVQSLDCPSVFAQLFVYWWTTNNHLIWAQKEQLTAMGYFVPEKLIAAFTGEKKPKPKPKQSSYCSSAQNDIMEVWCSTFNLGFSAKCENHTFPTSISETKIHIVWLSQIQQNQNMKKKKKKTISPHYTNMSFVTNDFSWLITCYSVYTKRHNATEVRHKYCPCTGNIIQPVYR